MFFPLYCAQNLEKKLISSKKSINLVGSLYMYLFIFFKYQKNMDALSEFNYQIHRAFFFWFRQGNPVVFLEVPDRRPLTLTRAGMTVSVKFNVSFTVSFVRERFCTPLVNSVCSSLFSWIYSGSLPPNQQFWYKRFCPVSKLIQAQEELIFSGHTLHLMINWRQ